MDNRREINPLIQRGLLLRIVHYRGINQDLPASSLKESVKLWTMWASAAYDETHRYLKEVSQIEGRPIEFESLNPREQATFRDLLYTHKYDTVLKPKYFCNEFKTTLAYRLKLKEQRIALDREARIAKEQEEEEMKACTEVDLYVECEECPVLEGNSVPAEEHSGQIEETPDTPASFLPVLMSEGVPSSSPPVEPPLVYTLEDKNIVTHCADWRTVCNQDFRVAYEGQVKLFIPDPPYGVLSVCRDTIGEVEMGELCALADTLLHENGTVVIFCSFQSFGIWDKIIRGQYKRLYVDPSPLLLIRKQENSKTNRHLYFMNNGITLFIITLIINMS